MNLLGWIIALITFPGIIMHELAHRLLCDLAGVPVYKVCYFRLGNPPGYVVHGSINSYWQALLISTAPLTLNTVIAFILFALALTVTHGVAGYVLYWLGISIAMHSFPSGEDADGLWRYSKKAVWRDPLALIGFPIVGLIKLSRVLRVIWFDLIYAVALLILAAWVFKGNSIIFFLPDGGEIDKGIKFFLSVSAFPLRWIDKKRE